MYTRKFLSIICESRRSAHKSVLCTIVDFYAPMVIILPLNERTMEIKGIAIRFSNEIKKPSLSAYLISSDDWPAFILKDRGSLTPLEIPFQELGTTLRIGIDKIVWHYFRPKRNCTYYSSGLLVMCFEYEFLYVRPPPSRCILANIWAV